MYSSLKLMIRNPPISVSTQIAIPESHEMSRVYQTVRLSQLSRAVTFSVFEATVYLIIIT